MANKKEWWQVHFDDNYLKTYIDITPADLTKLQVNFLISKLNLKPGTKLLDVACGYGRHAIPLAQKGIEVTGFDYSKKFINLARQQKQQLKLKNVNFVHGDMRQLSYKNQFDVAINMFTSFSYFANEAENLKVLQNIYRSLKPRGQFLIDYVNSARVISSIISKGKFNKKTELWELQKKDKQSNGLVVTTKHELDLVNMRSYMSRFWKEKGRQKSYWTDMRLYSYPELKALLDQAGFKVKQTWGGFKGGKLTQESSRVIMLASK